MPQFSRRSYPDPVRDSLVEVRRGLLRLHKALIDAERIDFERGRGPVTNAQLLQALIEEPFFAWLRPFSGLIVEIDEALAAREPISKPAARAFVERVRELVATPVDEPPELSRLEQVRTRHPDVLLAHLELGSRIKTALEH
ncbi:MAG TPA: hypothetical protein VF746_11060 [Longimicrobium sp.]|jgi:hypothetical protein